jgi:hypothetical protein
MIEVGSYETSPEFDVSLWEGQNDRTMKIMKVKSLFFSYETSTSVSYLINLDAPPASGGAYGKLGQNGIISPLIKLTPWRSAAGLTSIPLP